MAREEDLHLGELCLLLQSDTEGWAVEGGRSGGKVKVMKVNARNKEASFQLCPGTAEPYRDGFKAKHSLSWFRELLGSGHWPGFLLRWEQPLHPCNDDSH